MRLSGLSYGLLVSALLALASCSGKEGTPVRTGGNASVPVELAFALEGRAETRASVTTLLELKNIGSFRGMESIRLLPFETQGEVGPADQAIGPARLLPPISSGWDRSAVSGSSFHSGLIYNNQAHLYPSDYASMPLGTASALVYGKGAGSAQATTPEDKHLYGSLIERMWDSSGDFLSASDIVFSPEPILSGPMPEEAASLASLLNGIARAASYVQTYYYRRNDQWHEEAVAVTWNEDLADNVLREYFEWFTNGGELMAGAGSCVETLLSGLYSRLNVYYSVDDRPFRQLAGGLEYPAYLEPNGAEPLTYSMLYDGLRDTLLDRFEALEDAGLLSIDHHRYTVSLPEAGSSLHTYPTGLGLPAGSAVLRWNGLQFVVVTEGLDGIAAMDRFCYMPPLCYFVNTTVSTSTDPDMHENYTEDVPTWDAILSNYRQGKVVRTNTRAVALDDPLQFADALLVVTLRAARDQLPDRNGIQVPATNQNFPVTGIILGSQYPQRYNFLPDTSSPAFYLYDNQISGVCLTKTNTTDFRTLVLPTPDQEDVFFYLELMNNSGVTFTGAEGLIYPGNHFYLAGKLSLQEGRDENGQSNAFPAVFVQDYMTTVDCVVSSLENAHVSIPELDSQQLILGVQTDLNWIMASGTYVVLD